MHGISTIYIYLYSAINASRHRIFMSAFSYSPRPLAILLSEVLVYFYGGYGSYAHTHCIRLLHVCLHAQCMTIIDINII